MSRKPQTHCRFGHALTSDNVILQIKAGKRICKICALQYRVNRSVMERERRLNRFIGAEIFLKMSHRNLTDAQFLSIYEENTIPEPNTGCWIWLGRFDPIQNYGRIYYRGKSWGVHRLVYELLYGISDESLVVCHRCDNRACVNPDHLFLGTNGDNIHDALSKGRRTFLGATNPAAKLVEAQVREIFRLKTLGLGNRRIAKRLGVVKQTIANIVNGTSWKNIGWPDDSAQE